MERGGEGGWWRGRQMESDEEERQAKYAAGRK